MHSNVFVQPLESRRLLSAASTTYTQTNLVSDIAGVAQTQDANLINGWGLAAAPSGPFFVADNGTAVLTAYSGTNIILPTVQVPGSPNTSTAFPTGLVYNHTSGFLVGTGKHKTKAMFLSDSEDGTISAYVPKLSSTQATLVIDQSANNAVYKGLAIDTVGGKPFILAADFHNAEISVFDKNFASAALKGSFTDPDLPAGYAPFNVTVIKNKVYVAYAQQDTDKHDEIDAAGAGVIDIFTTQGQFVQRLATGGTLNGPWGMTLAPAKFGQFSNDLLVGNFGDGTINAFNLKTGAFIGQMMDSTGSVLAVNGLWGLAFGNGHQAGSKNVLYFAAGPNGEADGLFGAIAVTGATSANSSTGSSDPMPGGYVW